MASRVSQLLADCFAVFATPEAQRAGVSFDRELTALWAEALRLALTDICELEDAFARVSHERNELLAIARDTEMRAARARSAPVIHGRSPDIVELVCRHRNRAAGRDNVIDLTEVFGRERAARREESCHDPVA